MGVAVVVEGVWGRTTRSSTAARLYSSCTLHRLAYWAGSRGYSCPPHDSTPPRLPTPALSVLAPKATNVPMVCTGNVDRYYVEGVLREINEVAMVQHVRAHLRPSELCLADE